MVSAPHPSGTKSRGLVLIKTHKTASTTIAHLLARWALAQNLTCTSESHAHLKGGWGCPWSTANTALPRVPGGVWTHHATLTPELIATVTNHGGGGGHRRADAKPPFGAPFVLTIMREPIARHLSAWSYDLWSKIRGSFDRGKTWEAHVKAIQQSRHRYRCYYVNAMAHDLGWYESHGGSRRDDNNATAIREWVRHTMGRLDHVLLAERLYEGLVLLAPKLTAAGWPTSIEQLAVRSANAFGTRTTNRSHKRADLLRVGSDGVDMVLYRAALERHAREWAARPPTADAELRRLRRMQCRSSNCLLSTTDVRRKCAIRRRVK